MVVALIFTSALAVTFMVLFIINYAKRRKLEKRILRCLLDSKGIEL